MSEFVRSQVPLVRHPSIGSKAASQPDSEIIESFTELVNCAGWVAFLRTVVRPALTVVRRELLTNPHLDAAAHEARVRQLNIVQAILTQAYKHAGEELDPSLAAWFDGSN